VTQLSKKEKDLQASLKEKEAAAKKLQKEIERIIAEEIRKASERENTEQVGGFSLTSEEVALSGDFSNNMGKLPWPVDWGVVSSTFGEHPHPVLTKVKVKNNGIDILTKQGAQARSVFNGTVTRVLSVPNNNNVVIIRHGEYLTVYSNLDQVVVKQGEQVKTGQVIGTVFTNPDEARTEIHFEVWQSKTLLDPGEWLRK
jgi:septal ring factor EnvC (AmiA/AmiB activator)